MRAGEIGAGQLRQSDVMAEEAHLNFKTAGGARQRRAGREHGGGGIGSGHDSADGNFDAGARGRRGILAKLLVVCQLRFDVSGGGSGKS
jgi:hypothetical protein